MINILIFNVYKLIKVTNKKNNTTIEYVKELLRKYNLYDFINYYPNELSGGVRQK
jgi:NitT/TauT family transport system ATP-binding protein